MSMNSPHESVKDLASSLWKNNRPLAIALLVVAVVIGYVLYKKSQTAAQDAGAVTPSASGLPGNIINNTYTTITKTVTGQPAPTPNPIPVPTPGPTVGRTATIRGKQSSGIDRGWDSSHTGIPVRAQPSGAAAIVRILPFNSMVQLLQAALTAAPNQNGGSSQWYPVSGGYVSAWDIQSIK